MTRKEFSFNMILEDDRKATFKYWPYKDDALCNKAKMAEAGFYTSGKKSEADMAICYICHKELDGWEEDDDPWSEHKKHAPYCPFIKLGKKPSLLTLNDLLHLQKEQQCLLVSRRYEELKKEVEEHEDVLKGLLERAEMKENNKPRGPGRRKRSSRK